MLPTYLEHLTKELSEVVNLADFRIEVLTDDTGREQHLYGLGQSDAPHLILLPPYGMSFVLMAKIASLLANTFNVLIWESAGCPDRRCHVNDNDFSLSVQAKNLARILESLRIDKYHFVGWCQAAQLITQAIADYALQPTSMTWIGPAGFDMAIVKSEFERCALPIYLEIERCGPEEASKLAKILDKYEGKESSGSISVEQLTMLHLKDPETTRVFSKYMKCFEDHKAAAKDALNRALASTPTQIIHSRDDTFSHYSEAIQIAKRFPKVGLHLLDEGGHLQVFEQPEIPAELIFSFINECRSGLPEELKCDSQTISA